MTIIAALFHPDPPWSLSGILNLATASSRPSGYPCDRSLVAAGSDHEFSVCELLPVQLVCAAVVCDFVRAST